jgi:hypothetical protein
MFRPKNEHIENSQELLEEGCVFQERLGWERPGWFTLRGPAPVPKYDWYGAYGNSKNPASVYKELLQGDYSFGHPEHHHVVSKPFFTIKQPRFSLGSYNFLWR